MAENENLTNGGQNDEKRRKHQMEFIVEQQARIDANMESISLRLDNLSRNVGEFVLETREAGNNLSRNLGEFVAGTREAFNDLNRNVDGFVVETREAIGNLIIANEVTRDLTEQVARLAIQTSQRVSELEGK